MTEPQEYKPTPHTPNQYPPPGQYTPNPPPYQQPQQLVYVTNGTRETSSLATMSMIFGVLAVLGSCCTFGVFSIVAVVLAHMAWKETKSGEKGGHGLTVTGMVLGYLTLIPAIFFSISFVLQGASA